MWRRLHIWWKNTNKRKVLYGNIQGLFFCKEDRKNIFLGWWWRVAAEKNGGGICYWMESGGDSPFLMEKTL